MRRYRKMLFIITIIIATIIILGIVTVILSPKTITDSAYDAVILAVSAISIAIAIYSEIELNHESRRVEKMVKQINEMRQNINNDMAIDKNVRYKLDNIIALDEQIYRKVGGRKKPNELVKEAKATETKPSKS